MANVDPWTKEKFSKIAGIPLEKLAIPRDDFFATYAEIATAERTTVQAIEVMSINVAADGIEVLLEEKGFAEPAVYSILTAGMDAPTGAVLLGNYAEEGSPFASFPKTDIDGHSGQVFALKLADGKTMMILKGRAHPYEWNKDPYGDMVIAHPLQVLKEMARRQRATTGTDPVFLLTYLTGVREGREMSPGDLGLILDDSSFDNDTHPGHGPRAILDKYTGERFQPKDGRSSTKAVAAAFFRFAEERATIIYPVAAVGTPGTTEYQSSVEARLYDQPFEDALKGGNFGQLVAEMSDPRYAALLFGMGITAELATLRQTFIGEKDFKVLALGLATDAVGGTESKKVNHNSVVEAAFKKGEYYRDLLLQFLESSEFAALNENQGALMPDHTIATKLK